MACADRSNENKRDHDVLEASLTFQKLYLKCVESRTTTLASAMQCELH